MIESQITEHEKAACRFDVSANLPTEEEAFFIVSSLVDIADENMRHIYKSQERAPAVKRHIWDSIVIDEGCLGKDNPKSALLIHLFEVNKSGGAHKCVARTTTTYEDIYALFK